MRLYCRSLPEDHRRRYAAIEALKIGYGGVAYVARVLGISRRTIHTGIRELEQMSNDDPDQPQRPSGDPNRVRRRGGGRAPISEREPQLKAILHEVLEGHRAGSPTDERVRWTDLKPLQLAQRLLEHGIDVGRWITTCLSRKRLSNRSINGARMVVSATLPSNTSWAIGSPSALCTTPRATRRSIPPVSLLSPWRRRSPTHCRCRGCAPWSRHRRSR